MSEYPDPKPEKQEEATDSGVSLSRVELLRRELTPFFHINDTALNTPESGHVRFRGHYLRDPEQSYDQMRQRFEQYGFTPFVRKAGDQVAVIATPVVFDPEESRWSINLILLIVTILSTLYTGATYGLSEAGEFSLWSGWPFSLSLMLILGAHELGHYFAARYHDVPVTLPYFIPLPVVSLLGTLGAFIQLKAPVKNRRALLDVGAAGPLAGMLFALPILAYGLATSEVGPINIPAEGAVILEGNSILYAAMKIAIFGEMLPNNGIDVQLNQVAWAGWVGLLVTGLNLIPLGQLDGGHVAYVLFERRARWLFWPILAILAGLVIFTQTYMWAIWIVLLFFLGRYHAEPLDNVTDLDSRRRMVAIFTLILFFLVFVPIPLRILS